MENVNLNFNLTKEQKKNISALFEKMMDKYKKMSRAENPYFLGVVDGINDCHKVINEIEDDYLDGIKP